METRVEKQTTLEAGMACRASVTTCAPDADSVALDVSMMPSITALESAPSPQPSPQAQAPPIALATPKSATSPQSLTRHISKIRKGFTSPRRLVLAAGTVLALCAGIVDAVAFNQLHYFVSHVTGNVAHIGLRLEGNYNGGYKPHDLRYAFLLVLSFMFGSIICGLIIQKNEVRFGKELYGFALLGNSIFLIAATVVPMPEVQMYLAAAACGLQNGICTMHFGAVCRTTHVTGLVTDLGTAIGRILSIIFSRCLRRERLDVIDKTEIEVDLVRIRVYCFLVFGFGIGAAAGAFLEHDMGIWALLVPAVITGTGGLCYMAFRSFAKAKLEEWEASRVNEEMHEVEEMLERTRSFMIHAAQDNNNKKSNNMSMAKRGSLTHLDCTMSHMIDVMHDVEASIEELYGAQDHSRSHSTQSTPTRRHHHNNMMSPPPESAGSKSAGATGLQAAGTM